VRFELENEANESIAYGGHAIDAARLTNNALLQAVYAETLRLHVAALITRTVKKEHSVDAWLLQKGQDIIVASNVEHMHPQWDDAKYPVSGFHPDRFLTSSDNDKGTKKTFSLNGRQGQWIPFGLGEHLCPGRHFAKAEMIVNAAVILRTFEIQTLTYDSTQRRLRWRPDNDFARYGFGTQQPKEKVPFRVRRRRSRE
jgi:cytochrome P450